MKILIILLAALIFSSGTVPEEPATGSDETGTPEHWIYDAIYFSMTEEQRAAAPVEIKAHACGLSVDEFILLSSVVEAESNRSTTDTLGRKLIAETVLNRVNSGNWPNSITGVCFQSGQFAVVESGAIYSVGRTELSDAAVMEAITEVNTGSAPNVIYFNNSGYTIGDAYCEAGGNYFCTA